MSSIVSFGGLILSLALGDCTQEGDNATTFVIMTFNIITFKIMTFNIMEFYIMAFNRITFSITINKMPLNTDCCYAQCPK